MKTFLFEMITPQFSTAQMELISLDVPATEGRMTILAGHAPLVCAIAEGEVRLQPEGGQPQTWQAGTGTLSVSRDVVTLLLRSATEST